MAYAPLVGKGRRCVGGCHPSPHFGHKKSRGQKTFQTATNQWPASDLDVASSRVKQCPQVPASLACLPSTRFGRETTLRQEESGRWWGFDSSMSAEPIGDLACSILPGITASTWSCATSESMPLQKGDAPQFCQTATTLAPAPDHLEHPENSRRGHTAARCVQGASSRQPDQVKRR